MFHSFKRSLLVLLALGAFAGAQAQKSVSNTQGWHLRDKSTGYYGISLDKAYELVKGRKSNTVIVAVIDSGIDTTHEDLKPVLWTNPKEIPGNGIDDDKNGYTDDVHGWNFIGGKDGRNVKQDSYEAARVYHADKARFENVDPATLSKQDQVRYATWKRAKDNVTGGVNGAEVMMLQKMLPMFLAGDSIISADLKKAEYNGEDLKAYTPNDQKATMVKTIIMSISEQNKSFEISNKQIIDQMEGEVRKSETATKAPPNYRADIVKDNEADINDRFYGNNDIMASTPFHGTHVSGIIAAARGNGKGIDGIADNVRIMTIRAVPDGDEHDKDIALGIRYAVDNGAKIINMSFGKSFSPQKHWVDDAVRYAQSKGVLLVHAAGNDGANLDSSFNYPNPVFESDKNRAATWLTIGASGDGKSNDLAANFSNYGKNEVDVFSPGHIIYSTIPGGNTYGNASGTSMASPVTAGMAAFLLSYYPTLTAQQLKTIIEQTAVKLPLTTAKPGDNDGTKVPFADLSRTGGLINAYEAALMAEKITKGGKNVPSDVKIKVKTNETKMKQKDGKTKVKVEKKKEYKSF